MNYSNNFNTNSILVDNTPIRTYQLTPIKKTDETNTPITSYVLETASFNNKHYVMIQVNEPTNLHYQNNGRSKIIPLTSNDNTVISIVVITDDIVNPEIMDVGILKYKSISKLNDSSISVKNNIIVVSYQYFNFDNEILIFYDIIVINTITQKILPPIVISGANKLVVTIVNNFRYYISGTYANTFIIKDRKFTNSTESYFVSLINIPLVNKLEWIIIGNTNNSSSILSNTIDTNNDGSIYLCGSFNGSIILNKEFKNTFRLNVQSGWWGLLSINGKWIDGGIIKYPVNNIKNSKDHIIYTDIIASDGILHLVGTAKGNIGNITTDQTYPFYQKWGQSPIIINANTFIDIDRTVTMRRTSGKIMIGLHFNHNIILNNINFHNKGSNGLSLLTTNLKLARYIEYNNNNLQRPTFSGCDKTIVVNNLLLGKNRVHGFINIYE